MQGGAIVDNNELRLEQMDAYLDRIGARDGYFSIKEEEGGCYLSVVAPQGGKAVSDAEIAEYLQRRGIRDFDRTMIIRAIKEGSGTPMCVAVIEKDQAAPTIRVTISRDRLEAYLEIDVPIGGRIPEIDEVIDQIQEADIRYGVDYEEVEKARRNPGIRVVCARGMAPEDGDDAYIRHHIDFAGRGKPKELENGQVDFKNLDMFIKVGQGDLLLEKIPASAGRPGIDVLGQRILPKHGQDVMLPMGKNVQLQDCRKMIAAIAGQVLVEDRRVSVVPVIEVNGDVDLSTGNIDFPGNVVIRGSVQTGFFVKAGGDVEIYGTVSGGVVEGKDVIIRMGIIGMQSGYVNAVQDLQAKFIQNAIASAGRDILVRDGIINSEVSAGRNVRVDGGNGSVVGGMISAGEEIYARTVGTSRAAGTELRVGVNPALREEYQHLRQEYKKAEANLESICKNLRMLQSVDRNHLSDDKKELLMKMTQGQFRLRGQIEALQQRINEIDIAFESMRYGRIKVHDRVAAGTKIIIGALIKPLRDDFKYVKFYEADGEIRMGSIS